MDSKVNYALVGLFVIILSIVLVASILWFSVGTEKKIYQTYQVYIQESVSGLNPKALVKYRGVKVGYVREISLVAERPNEVRVLLDIVEGVPLKQDTLALLSIQGLTGLAYIELSGGSRDAPPLIRQQGQTFPEIKTKPSLLVRLDTAIFSLFDKLNKISGTTDTLLNKLSLETSNNLFSSISKLSSAVNVLLSEKNHSAITNILHNLEVVSGTLAARADNIDVGISNVVQSTENFNKISEHITQLLIQLKSSLVAIEKSSNAFAQIAKAVEKTSNTFTKTADMVNKLVQKFEGTNDVIAKTAGNINVAFEESRRDMDYFTRQALPEVTNSLRELRVLLSNLRNFAQELERKPNMLLFGKSKVPLGPGEK